MPTRLAIVIAALALSGSAPQHPAPNVKRTVAELKGRTRGKPQRCISGQPGLLFYTTDAHPHLLIYDDGKKIWVSNLGPSCGFGPGQTVVPDDSASYYCKGDFVRAGSRIILIP